ncbi:hypothetical protein [Neobacillus niacini]|uniref:hypothetical protein n=1 Tax=Neobacillus niacini TaxID=86668 RepID=UPI00285FBEF0|nr:hypothetical protein [Neobacillus niacini]MDR7000994.1 hypothetical protein [Neobacillus niacini]
MKEVEINMSDLSDFLRKKKAEYEQEQVDWNKVKIEWLKQLKEFTENIKSWLEQSQKEGLIKIVEKEIEIKEEHIGNYKAPSLELIIGTESIKITPVGRLIIGAKGRVDISSFINRFIVLQHSEKGWIYRNEGKKGNFQAFSEESFTKLLEELV